MQQVIRPPAETRVELLGPEHDRELVAFLDSLAGGPAGPAALGYHYPENRDMLAAVLEGSRPCYLATRSRATGELRAVLPGMLKRAGDGACYNSLPFFGPNAGVLAATESPEEYALLAAPLTRAAVDHAREQGALTAVFYTPFNPEGRPLPNPAFDALPGATRIPKFTQFLRLPGEEGPAWPNKIPWDITKAVNRGVTVSDEVTPEDLAEVYRIYARNCEERGIPLKPWAAVEALGRAGPRRVRAYTARLNGQIIAGLLVLWGPETVSYYLPCVDVRHRSLQPVTLLIDRACRDAARAGLRYWNWESSPGRESGVYQFKKKWGSDEAPYEIVVIPLTDPARLREIGAAELAARFPFYFVYPYDRL